MRRRAVAKCKTRFYRFVNIDVSSSLSLATAAVFSLFFAPRESVNMESFA